MRVGVAIVLAVSGAGSVAAQNRTAINLITSNQVVIDRPAAAIWPKIVDPSGWKQGLKLVHRSGPIGGQGEILAAVAPNDTTAAFLIENAVVTPNAQRTIKLILPNGQLIGFATWTLVESGGKTTVRYDVVSETVITPAQLKQTTAAALAQREKTERETNAKRFDAELKALKKLVEGR